MLPMVRAALLSATLLLPARPTHAQTPPAQPTTEDLSMEVRKSFGCLATGTGGTLAAIGFGPENLVNLVSGGIVTPANSAVLAIGVVGVVFASFCTVGESLTPSVLYFTDRATPVATRIADATIATASAALEATTNAARATGTTLTNALSPTIDATLEAADTALAAATATTHRLAAAALATASEAIDTARTATLSPTAWADAGWNALADLCLQSPLCHARVIQAPAPPRDIASR